MVYLIAAQNFFSHFALGSCYFFCLIASPQFYLDRTLVHVSEMLTPTSRNGLLTQVDELSQLVIVKKRSSSETTDLEKMKEASLL